MANIQKTLDALQPYVIGIRYVDSLPLIDTVFKDGWTLPDSNIIKKVKGNDELNYYMIFSEQEGIGLDELLEYVDVVIKANIEREKKHELLKEKVNELKELFKKTSLIKLKQLKFTFNDEELIPEFNDFNISEEFTEPIVNEESTNIVETITEQQTFTETELTEEDAEILAEEQRAENYRRIKENNFQINNVKKISHNLELPPKKSIQNSVSSECDCGPHEACSKCIETKDL